MAWAPPGCAAEAAAARGASARAAATPHKHAHCYVAMNYQQQYDALRTTMLKLQGVTVPPVGPGCSRVRECSTVRRALPFTKASRCWPASRIGIRLLVASRDAVPASPCSSRVLEGRVLKGRVLEGEESSTVIQGLESQRPHELRVACTSDGDPTARSIERCCVCKLLLRGSIGQHGRAPLEPLRVSTAEAPEELRPRP